MTGNNLDMLKVTLPVTQQVIINETVSISATTNIDQSRLKFEWYKVNDKFSSEEVKLVNNPTACTSTLVFEKFAREDDDMDSLGPLVDLAEGAKVDLIQSASKRMKGRSCSSKKRGKQKTGKRITSKLSNCAMRKNS